ncbi:protein MAINTENANCE OF MERISTEMS-like [Vigna umbellata]|uniref:protein MAINTENANCE OF MERISTEMS-like n=1 Tax=Vigna umbellata TaxID=87088 RepID=UPI001F5F7077|nr:protein MAINTENANCE OF MERISTEMS-like [Vigna umbellata]
MPLTDIFYDYVDKGLLLGFIERWHFETSSFHVPVGEMSITLDDVSTLLHLPVLGQLCDLEELEFEETRTTLVELLGIDGGAAGVETEDAHGLKVRLSWLREIYVQRCNACGIYAWSVPTLAHLYDQLGGMRSWTYEYFPTMGRRRLVSSYDETTPRAARCRALGRVRLLRRFGRQLDGLTYSGVVWHPYEGHRGIRPFFGIGMYSDGLD